MIPPRSGNTLSLQITSPHSQWTVSCSFKVVPDRCEVKTSRKNVRKVLAASLVTLERLKRLLMMVRQQKLHQFLLILVALATESSLGRRSSPRDRAVNRLGYGFRSIGSIFVINLEHRKDRLSQVNEVMDALGVAHHKKVNAVPHSCGPFGCSMSHIMALSECLASNSTECAIIEDDFMLLRSPEDANAAVERFFWDGPSSWQVLMLSSSIQSSSPSPHSFLDIVHDAQTTSGYIVRKSYAGKLLQNFLLSAYHLNQNECPLPIKMEYAIDMYWKRLQSSGEWFALKPLIGKQRPSYSDIEKTDVDFNV